MGVVLRSGIFKAMVFLRVVRFPPFLFSILMTVALHDANANLVAQGIKFSEGMLVHELLYADDTLLVESDPDAVAAYMQHGYPKMT